jgi:transposase-like protein
MTLTFSLSNFLSVRDWFQAHLQIRKECGGGSSDIHQRKIWTTNLIEGVLNKALKQRSKVIGIFPNRESCLRYACLRLMEIDEDWQTGRKYMKMIEDEDSDTDEDLIKDINKIKQGVSAKEELVVC